MYFHQRRREVLLRSMPIPLNNLGLSRLLRYLEGVLDRLEFIAEDPKRGTHRPEPHADYFSSFAGSHTIYCRVISDQVQVIDILHQSMEPARYLSK